MNNNSFFDEVRNAVESESVDYNPENWESLKTRLDKRRKRRFGFLFFRWFHCLGISLCGLILLSLATWYFIGGRRSTGEEKTAKAQASPNTDNVSVHGKQYSPTTQRIKVIPDTVSNGEMIAYENEISKEQGKATIAHNHFSSEHRKPESLTNKRTKVIAAAGSNDEMISNENEISKEEDRVATERYTATTQRNRFSGRAGNQPGRKDNKKVHKPKLTGKLPSKNSLKIIPADIDKQEDQEWKPDDLVIKTAQPASSKQDSLSAAIPVREAVPDTLKKKDAGKIMVKTNSKKSGGALNLFSILGISRGKHFTGWNGELMIDKGLSKNFSVQAGLSYYGFHGKIPVTTMHIEEIPSPGIGVLYDTTYSRSQRWATSHYAGLFAGFSWKQNRFSLFVHGYYNYNLLSKSKLERISTDAREKYSNYSAGVRAGGYYNLGSRHSIGITGRFDFLKFHDINPGNSFQLNYRVKLF